MAFTPLGCINAAIVKGLPQGWEFSEAAHGFFHASGAIVEASPVRGSFVWEATTADFDDKTFHASKLMEALTWAA